METEAKRSTPQTNKSSSLRNKEKLADILSDRCPISKWLSLLLLLQFQLAKPSKPPSTIFLRVSFLLLHFLFFSSCCYDISVPGHPRPLPYSLGFFFNSLFGAVPPNEIAHPLPLNCWLASFSANIVFFLFPPACPVDRILEKIFRKRSSLVVREIKFGG